MKSLIGYYSILKNNLDIPEQFLPVKNERQIDSLFTASTWKPFNGVVLIARNMKNNISDGYLHAFITEMIIAPDFQNQGIGKEIISTLVDKALDHGITDIQLFCAKGKEKFYLKNGFVKRPDNAPGMQYKLK